MSKLEYGKYRTSRETFFSSYHILRLPKDPEVRETLSQHLVKVHLLGTELSDERIFCESSWFSDSQTWWIGID